MKEVLGMKKRKEITRRIRIIKKMLEDHGTEYSIGEEENLIHCNGFWGK